MRRGALRAPHRATGTPATGRVAAAAAMAMAVVAATEAAAAGMGAEAAAVATSSVGVWAATAAYNHAKNSKIKPR